MPPSEQAPATLVDVGRGELAESERTGGHTLIWLWPTEPPEASSHPQITLVNGQVRGLELHPGESMTIRRGVVPTATLVPGDGGWQLVVPSNATYADVSRTPTRVLHLPRGELVVETQAQGAQRFWLDLTPVAGPTAATVVEPWSAIGVGPVVLWYVPQSLAESQKHVMEVDPALRESMPGFRCYSLATAEMIMNLRRRARMRVLVPKNASGDRWEASQPFLLAGEPGCGKTTLARAVYRSVLDSDRFSVVHPVAAEAEIDLIELMGCANFAHDGARVPDQAGSLDTATFPDGVVLIDEVHTLGDRLCEHLIDLLTEWTFRPRGDNTSRKRIRGLVAFATNRLDVVRDPRRFPGDLFARMGGEAGIIELPPLRRRRWEVAHLAEAVLSAQEPPLTFAPNAMRKLLLHAWPLNHWELEDVVREAHSLATAQHSAEIQPEHLKVASATTATAEPGAPDTRTTPTSPAASTQPTGPTTGAPPTASHPVAAKASWVFPKTTTWAELFGAVHHLGGFTELRDAWQVQLGAKNSAAVNRRIGRLVRCDRCEPATCPKCFVGQLAQLEPGPLMERLAQVAAQTRVGEDEVMAWIPTALGELVVERMDVFRNTEARAALANATANAGRADMETLLSTLRRQLFPA